MSKIVAKVNTNSVSGTGKSTSSNKPKTTNPASSFTPKKKKQDINAEATWGNLDNLRQTKRELLQQKRDAESATIDAAFGSGAKSSTKAPTASQLKAIDRQIARAEQKQRDSYSQKYAGKNRTTIDAAMRKLKGDKSEAAQHEYQWLQENQYNYWTTDQLKSGIKAAESQSAKAKKTRDTAGDYDVSTMTEKEFKASQKKAKAGEVISKNSKESEAMRRALEDRAYSEQLAKLPESTRDDLINRAGKWQFEASRKGKNNSSGMAYKKSSEESLKALRKDLKAQGLKDDQVEGLLSYSKRIYNGEVQAQNAKSMEALSDKGFAGKAAVSAASVPLNLAGGVAGVADLAIQRATAKTDPFTGQRQSIDFNRGAQAMGNAAQAARAAVSKDMSAAGSFLYNTGMSIADFLVAGSAGSAVAETLLGSSAAQNAAQEAHKRGATDDQALMVGLASGVAEALFEHLSLEKLDMFKVKSSGVRLTAREVADAMVKQGFTEGSEEVATTLANTLTDAIIMGDKSDLNTSIRAYMDQGLSREDATRQAWKDWAVQLSLDGLGGALSGGVTSGTVAAGSVVGNTLNDLHTGQDIVRGQGITADFRLEEVQEGLNLPKGSRANKQATAILKKMAAGQQPSALDIGRMNNLLREDLSLGLQPRANREGVGVTTLHRDEQTGAVNAEFVTGPITDAFQEQGLNVHEAILRADVLQDMLNGDDVAGRRLKDKLQIFSDETKAVLEQMTGATVPDGMSAAETIEFYKTTVRDFVEQREADLAALEAEGEALEQRRQEYEESAAKIEETAQQQAEETMNAAIEEAEANQAEAPTEGEQTSTPQPKPAMSREDFEQRYRQQFLARHGREANDKQVEAAWNRRLENDGILLDDGRMIGKSRFFKEVAEYYATLPESDVIDDDNLIDGPTEMDEDQLMGEFLERRALSRVQPEDSRAWPDENAPTEETTGEETAQSEEAPAEEQTEQEEAQPEETPTEEAPVEEAPVEEPAEKSAEDLAKEAFIEHRKRSLAEAGESEEIINDEALNEEMWEKASASEKYSAYITSMGVDVVDALENKKASQLWSFLNDLVAHGGDLSPEAAARTFVEFFNKAAGMPASPKNVVTRAYELAGQEIPAGIREEYVEPKPKQKKAPKKKTVIPTKAEAEAAKAETAQAEEAKTEEKPTIPSKAQTEEAKEKLQAAITVPVQTKNTDAIERGIESGELTKEMLTYTGGNMRNGFSMYQRVAIAEALVDNNVYLTGDDFDRGASKAGKPLAIEINVPGDGKLTIQNTPSAIAQTLDRLGVKVNQRAAVDSALAGALKKDIKDRNVTVVKAKSGGNYAITNGNRTLISVSPVAAEGLTTKTEIDGNGQNVGGFDGRMIDASEGIENMLGATYNRITEAPTAYRDGRTTNYVYNVDGVDVAVQKGDMAYLDGGALYGAKIGDRFYAIKSVNPDGTVRGYTLAEAKPGIPNERELPNTKSFTNTTLKRTAGMPQQSGPEKFSTGAKPNLPRQTGRFGGLTVKNGKKVTYAMQATAELMQELFKPYGIEHVVFDGDNLGPSKNASVRGNTIRINENLMHSAGLMYWAVGHELTHPSAESDPNLTNEIIKTLTDLYKAGALEGELASEIMDQIANPDAAVAERKETYTAMYTDDGLTPAEVEAETTDEKMREELAADWMGYVLFSQPVLERIAGTKPTLLTRVLRAIDRIKGTEVNSLLKSGKTYRDSMKAINDLADRMHAALDASKDKRVSDTMAKYSVPKSMENYGRDQEESSEETSIPQTPATFTSRRFAPTDRVLDWGAGKYDYAKQVLSEKYPGIAYGAFDPWNRTAEANQAVLDMFAENPATAVTLNNVLNVIKDQRDRVDAITESKKYLAPDGVAYFLIYEGDRSGNSRKTTSGWQNNQPASWYLEEVGRAYANVKTSGNLIIASDDKAAFDAALKSRLPKDEAKALSERSRALVKSSAYKAKVDGKSRTAYHFDMTNWRPGDAELPYDAFMRGETSEAKFSATAPKLPALTEKQEANREKNNAATVVGSKLQTLNGSPIKRYKGIVGKEVSGQVYVHKNYADQVVPEQTLTRAKEILSEAYPDFEYNTVMYDKNKGTVRFDEAPDFDTAREPIPGNYVTVNPNDGSAKTGYSDYIWHHKWLWVQNDYKGFDVKKSWDWSKQWLNELRATDDKVSNRGIANGSGHGTANWNAQLEYFGLPHDDQAGTKYSAYGSNPFFDNYMKKMQEENRARYLGDNPPVQRQSQTRSTDGLLTDEEKETTKRTPGSITHTEVKDEAMQQMVGYRLDTDEDVVKEKRRLFRKDKKWDAADTATAEEIIKRETEKARETGDYSEVRRLLRVHDAQMSDWGLAGHTAREFGESFAGIVADATDTVDQAVEHEPGNQGKRKQADRVAKGTSEAGKDALGKVRDELNAAAGRGKGNRPGTVFPDKKTYDKQKQTGGKSIVDSNMVNEPFTFEYADAVGTAVAKGVDAKLKQSEQSKTFLQQLQSEIMRFASETLPVKKRRKAPTTATELLKSYVENRDFFEQSWTAARDELRRKYGDKLPAGVQRFMRGWYGLSDNALNSKIMRAALVSSAMSSEETVDMIRKQAAVGAKDIGSVIAKDLIAKTGAKGELANMINVAADFYVDEVLDREVTVKGQKVAYDAAQKQKTADRLIQNALRDIGKAIDKDTGPTSMKKLGATSAASKAVVHDAVVNTLINKYAVSEADAERVADVVGKRFDALLREGMEQRLESIFKEKKKPDKTKQQSFLDRVIELTNLGAMDSDAYRDAAVTKLLDDYKTRRGVSATEVLNKVYDYADRLDRIPEGDVAGLKDIISKLNAERWTGGMIKGNEIHRTLRKAIDTIGAEPGGERFLRQLAAAQIRGIANDNSMLTVTETLGSVRYLAMLSKLTTTMRNLVGNTTFDITETLSNNFATPLDMLLSKVTGRRTTDWDLSYASSAKRRGMVDAARRAYIEVALDAPIEDGQNRWEMKDGRTFKMAKPEKTTALNAVPNMAERLLSSMEKWQRYLLTVSDEFYKGGIRDERQRGIDRLKDRGLLEEDALQNEAQQVALERTFQNRDKMATALDYARTGLDTLVGVKDYKGNRIGLGTALMPFARVPANIVGQVFNYSPAGLAKAIGEVAYVVKAGKRATAEEQAKAVRDFGRGINGTALIGLFALAAIKGALKHAGSGDDDKDALLRDMGQTGTQLNLDALQRIVKNQDPTWKKDDTLVSIGGIEPLNGPMAFGALLADSLDENGPIWAKILNANFQTGMASLADLPAMSSINNIANAYKYSDEKYDEEENPDGGPWKQFADAAATGASDFASSFVPNILGGVAAGMDEGKTRTTRTSDKRGLEAIPEETLNSLKLKIPGLRSQLPQALDSFGKPRQTTAGKTTNWLNSNVLPLAINSFQPNPVSQELISLKDSGAQVALPKRNAIKTVDTATGQKKLTESERREYQQKAGGLMYDNMLSAMSNSTYKSSDDELRAKVWANLKSYAGYEGKKAVGGKVKKDEKGNEVLPSNIAWSKKYDGSTSDKAIAAACFTAAKQKAGIEDTPTIPEVISAVNATNLSSSMKDMLITKNISEAGAEKYNGAKAVKLSASKYVELLDATSQEKMPADKKDNGDSISGSRKKKVVAYLDAQVQNGYLTPEQRDFIIHDVYGWK